MICDEHGELALSRRIVDDPETFRGLGDPDRTRAALEATYGCEWLAELLKEAGYNGSWPTTQAVPDPERPAWL